MESIIETTNRSYRAKNESRAIRALQFKINEYTGTGIANEHKSYTQQFEIRLFIYSSRRISDRNTRHVARRENFLPRRRRRRRRLFSTSSESKLQI